MPVISPETLFEAASYHWDAHGWSVFPCCDKVPVGRWKQFQNKRPTKSELRSLFDRNDINGFGVFAGPVSDGLAIVDYDLLDDYRIWTLDYIDIALRFPTVRTYRGCHVYFRGPSLFWKIKNGEYRGTGKQFTVLPPSIHPESGKPYRWMIEPGRVIPKVDDPHSCGFLPKSPEIGKIRDIPTKTPLNSLILHRDSFSSPQPGIIRRIANSEEVRRRAILHCPTKVGERNAKILRYVRSIKGIAEKWDGQMALIAFGRWWELAREIVGTKSEHVSWYEFAKAFQLCHSPQKRLDVDRLREEAAKIELQLDESNSRLRLLAQACVIMQQWNAPEPFYFSWVDAARLVGKSERWGQWAFNRLIADGFIIRVRSGNNFQGRASTYRLVDND